jgi:hypothetical protein
VTERNSAEDAREKVLGSNETGTETEIEYLRQHMMRNWWWLCLALWLTIGALSLWWLRADLQMLREYFTWAAVKYMLVYSRLAAMGLGLCFGITLALLYAESRHILLGLSKGEKLQLTDRLIKIRAQGPSHPQWRIIHPAENRTAPRSKS